MTKAIDRRNFFARFLFGNGSTFGLPKSTLAADGNRVDENGTLAQSLAYKHDALEVDSAKHPQRSGEAGESQYCFNCELYQGGTDDAWSGCGIFKNKQVAGRGWCNAWIAKNDG